MTAVPSQDDMHRVKFVHEPVHERLLNWSRWCLGGRGGASSAPMFRHYRAGYKNATEFVSIPVDGLDALRVEKAVNFLPEQHRDALRWFYVYSHRGMSIWRAVRGLAVHRDTLVRLIHDGRSMLKNRLDTREIGERIPTKFNSAPAASVSPREAEVPAKRPDRLRASCEPELTPA